MTDLEIEILKLAERFRDELGEDACFTYDYLNAEMREVNPTLSKKAVKKLREQGYLQFHVGLVNAEGEFVGGSGHALTPEGQDWIVEWRAK